MISQNKTNLSIVEVLFFCLKFHFFFFAFINGTSNYKCVCLEFLKIFKKIEINFTVFPFQVRLNRLAKTFE